MANRVRKKISTLSMALLVSTGLWACQSDGRPIFDKTIAPDRQIQLLEGGPHAVEADTGSAVVAFEYVRQSSTAEEVVLAVNGRILSVRGGRATANIYLLALERNGNVLLRRVLYASGYKHSTYVRRTWSFNKTISLPPETVAVAIDAYTQASRGHK